MVYFILLIFALGAISYVWSVFELIDLFMKNSLSMGFLEASELYFKLAIASSLFAPIYIYFKNKVCDEVYRSSEHYALQAAFFYISLYLLVISTIYTCFGFQLLNFKLFDLGMIMIFILQLLVVYMICSRALILILDVWRNKEWVLKIIFCTTISIFIYTVT
jgi:hypothetical protein